MQDKPKPPRLLWKRRPGEPPPRQMSADPAHQWHIPEWVAYAEVSLDGQVLRNCRTYDADAGWVEVICEPARIVGDDLAAEIRHGVVTVRDRGDD